MKRHHVLTHAHKDHIVARASYPIYSITLLLQFYPQPYESVFAGVEVENPDGDFVVTAFDANHCPGAVPFLFEGTFSNIFHAGVFAMFARQVHWEERERTKLSIWLCLLRLHIRPSKHSAMQQESRN